jgi:hypothetical protein
MIVVWHNGNVFTVYNAVPMGNPLPTRYPAGTGTGKKVYPWARGRVRNFSRCPCRGGHGYALPAPLPSLLTGACAGHNSGRGGVLSPRTPTASWMVLQCPRWRRDGRGGRTGPMATEETRFTGPTSQRGLRRARDRRLPPPFEGSAVLFRGCDTSAVRDWVAQCHGVDTGLTA